MSKKESMVVKCGSYEVTVFFAKKENPAAVEQAKELIMSAYDLRKQKMYYTAH